MVQAVIAALGLVTTTAELVAAAVIALVAVLAAVEVVREHVKKLGGR